MVDVDGVSNELDATMPAPLRNLNHALGSLLDEFGLVQFVPLDISRAGSVQALMQRVDMATQFGEDEDVRVPRDEDVRQRARARAQSSQSGYLFLSLPLWRRSKANRSLANQRLFSELRRSERAQHKRATRVASVR